MTAKHHDTGYKEVFSYPEVLYNGSRRWSAPQDIYQMIQPEPPSFLRVYQPQLRYYLVDEGA